MSPERPPSQSMGGTNLIEHQQQQTSITNPATNMVLSTIPIETGHVVIHHHPQQQSSPSINGTNGTTTYTQLTRNGISQNLVSTATVVSSSTPQLSTKTISAMTAAATSSPSKYVVIHQNGNGQYRTADGATAAAYLAQSNGVGNIVLLATEPMEMTRTDASNIIVNTNGQGNDEELTPLTWLQDKDLLKDLVVRANGAKTAAATTSPTRHANGGTAGGPISPTSDFMEDSSVSEDNVSSMNSSSDQGISISSSEFSPTSSTSSTSSVPNSAAAFTTYQQQQYHPINVSTTNQQHQSPHFINNNTLTKNRNHIISPAKSGGAMTQSLAGATAYTIAAYNGPSGTTTVVEYKAGSNFSPPTATARQIVSNHAILSPQRSPSNSSESATVTITSASSNSGGSQLSSPNSSSSSMSSNSSSGGGGGSGALSMNTSTPSTTPHQHYHKKYIREQMNGVDQQNHHHQQQSQQKNGNDNGAEYRVVNGVNNGQQQHQQIYQQQSQHHFNTMSDPEDVHRTPIKIEPGTTSFYTNGHDERLMARETLNFDSPTAPATNGRPLSATQKTNNSSNNINNSTTSASSSSIGGATSTILGGGGNVSNGGNSSSTIPSSAASPKQKHPTNVPYDPMVHTTNKPPYSFSSLIFMAIEDSPEKALPVKEIYAWIVQHFPYFKSAPVGWKNSVRHNLSLNKSFLKVEKAPNMGKGSLWRVEEHQRQNLIQALARSPFHQASAVDKFSPYKSSPNAAVSSSSRSSLPPESPPTSVKCNVNPELFPKLYKTIKDMANKGVNNGTAADCGSNTDRDEISSQHQSSYPYSNNGGVLNGSYNGVRDYYGSNGGIGGGNGGGVVCENGRSHLLDYSIERLARDCGADSIDDVNAATAMLALKHGPNIFNEHFQNGSPVITSSPSEDHTYSAGGGNNGGGGGVNGSGANSTHNGSDNNSSGVCSDAAYDSGDERLHQQHRSTTVPHATDEIGDQQRRDAEALEEQRRHAEGVDALLSFASSAASSPAKRPSSTSVEEEHISSYTENIPHYLPSSIQNGATSTAITARYITNDDGSETIVYHHSSHHPNGSSNNNNNISHHHNHQHHPPQRLSTSSASSTTYETPSYYLSTLPTSATKKLKQSRGIRTKLKRKTTLIR